MNDKKNKIDPFILCFIFGVIGAIIAGGNKSNTASFVGLLIGILFGAYVSARINGKIKF